MNFEKLAKIADSIMNPKIFSVSQIKDAKVGDPFDNGDVQGKILEIKTDEDGTKTVVVESQNEDGEVENVEVAIEDSKDSKEGKREESKDKSREELLEILHNLAAKHGCFYDDDLEEFYIEGLFPDEIDEKALEEFDKACDKVDAAAEEALDLGFLTSEVEFDGGDRAHALCHLEDYPYSEEIEDSKINEADAIDESISEEDVTDEEMDERQDRVLNLVNEIIEPLGLFVEDFWEENGVMCIQLSSDEPIGNKVANKLKKEPKWKGLLSVDSVDDNCITVITEGPVFRYDYNGFFTNNSKISDGSARKNDAMDLFIRELIGKRKAHCPKTGDWELTETQIFNNGKKVYDLPEKVTVTKLTEIIPEIYKKVEEKIDDSHIQDDGYGYVPDQAMDELLDYGEALFPIPEGKNASDVWTDVDMILQSYVGPNGHVNSSYEERDGGVYIKIEEEGTEIE